MNTQLLTEVRDTILEEPRRINMSDWGKSVDTDYDKNPPCGTVACISGWAIAIHWNKRGQDFDDFMYSTLENGEIPLTEIDKVLDLTGPMERRLFYASNWPDDFRRSLAKLAAGTPEYAAVVAARIDHFIATDGAE